jgi:hypothetical protein
MGHPWISLFDNNICTATARIRSVGSRTISRVATDTHSSQESITLAGHLVFYRCWCDAYVQTSRQRRVDHPVSNMDIRFRFRPHSAQHCLELMYGESGFRLSVSVLVWCSGECARRRHLVVPLIQLHTSFVPRPKRFISHECSIVWTDNSAKFGN